MKQFFFLSCQTILIILFSANTFAQVNLDSGLVGFFPFNGDANDESEFAIDGTVNGAILTAGINNNMGSAYYFDGISTNINFSNDDRNIKDTITISAWIKTSSTNNGFLITKYDQPNDQGFHLGINNGHLTLGGRNNSGYYTNTGFSNDTINDGEWHHVMGVIYGNTWEIWIDCQLDTYVYSFSNNPDLTNNEPLTIGNYNMGSNGDYKHYLGAIDQVRIYNRTLSSKEINVLCTIEATNNINKVVNDHKISTFPNPTKNFINIDATGLVIQKVEIYNLVGAKLMTYSNNIKSIDISEFNTGVYLLKIYDSSGTPVKSVRVVKK